MAEHWYVFRDTAVQLLISAYYYALDQKCMLSITSYLDSGYRSWCQSAGLTACFLGCAKRWTLSERGMHGFSLASSMQMTGSLTGQLRASCRPCCTLASASGRTCRSGHNGEPYLLVCHLKFQPVETRVMSQS